MEDIIFLKKGEAKIEKKRNGKVYNMLMKSTVMEAIISELEESASSRMYNHKGEEIHIVLEGKIEYKVGKRKFVMDKGDTLWHRSTTSHGAKNLGKGKAIYLTVGSPPTFM
jgi:mannose-6-phosphate isomerase-like protein (cupin superfamily)